MGTYWFSTGTPSFLIEKLKIINFDPERFTNGTLYADGNALSDYRADNPDPVPLLYQTGYLTIKDYDKKYRSYMLTYPNDEVKYSFIESLAPYYLYYEKPYTADPGMLYKIGVNFNSKERTLDEWKEDCTLSMSKGT